MTARPASLADALRHALRDHFPTVDGVREISVLKALNALITCQAYLIANAPAELRQRLLCQCDDQLSAVVRSVVRSGHPVVGAGIVVTPR